jgi:alkylhydroperoxidase family enzyme
MFLKDVRDHQPAERNRYADGIRMMEASGGFVPGIWHLFAFRPALAEHLGKLAQEVLRGPSKLTPGFRELIAAFVSARNHCLF